MTEYSYKTCPICGVHYAVDKVVMDYKQRAKKPENPGWHCPNGHQLVFIEREADRLERELNNAKQQIARAEDEKRDAERRLAQAEATTKRIKKRASAGNCPCCKRTFANMARHMKHQHPEFVQEGGAKVVPIKARA